MTTKRTMLRDNFPGLKFGTRWHWAKNLNSPENVTDGHIKIVYRLDKDVCSLGNCDSTCKASPLCLNGLGQSKRTDLVHDTTLNSDFQQTVDQPFRNGLKNYGSTCYLNAFLQLYFRFGKLRQAIYAIPSENDETGIIYQLQVIFSQLQLSQSGVVDPGGLIEALRLCEEEQQDAPEFHCLFMNLLEARLREFCLSTVDDLFRGETVYETRCLNCDFTSRQPSKFLELSLKVSSNSLVGCITDYLKAEPLAGENQYACPRCGGKQDGIRRVYITRAPSLLCVQLLRFTYDPRTGQRKKQKATIRLPDTLELTELTPIGSRKHPEHSVACLVPQTGTPCPRTYRLCGVLLHIGTQPTSGHYIAVVRDSGSPKAPKIDPASGLIEPESPTDFWTICNDVDVCSIPANQFNLSKVNGSTKSLQTCIQESASQTFEDSVLSSKPCGKRSKKLPRIRVKKSRRDIEETNVTPFSAPVSTSEMPHLDFLASDPSLTQPEQTVRWHASPNAYMLFYQSVEENQQQSGVFDVPDHLRQMVEEVNLYKYQAMQDQRALLANRRERVEELVSKLWPTDSPSLSSISLVPTQWLAHWFDNPEQPPQQLCPSSKEAPNRSAPTDSPDRNTSMVETKFDPNSSTGSSSQTQPPVLYFYPVCQHNRVPVDVDAHVFRVVSTVGLQRLLERWPDLWKNTNLESLQPCRTCVRLNVALIHLKRSIQELSRAMDSYVRSQSSLTTSVNSHCVSPKSEVDAEPSYYWIGRRSLMQWRSLAREYVKALYSRSEADPSCTTPSKAPPTSFNADVLCPHGNLRVNSKFLRRLPSVLWFRLVALFPGAVIPTFAVLPQASLMTCAPSNYTCVECESLEAILVQRAAQERRLLPNLISSATRRLATPLRISVASDHSSDEVRVHELLVDCFSPRKPFGCHLTNVHSAHPLSEHGQISLSPQINNAPKPHDLFSECPDSRAVYLVPMDFVNRWRRFIRHPSPDTVPQCLPSGLNGRNVLCPHDQLSMPWWNLISDGILCPLTAEEWCTLARSYPLVNASAASDCYRLDDPQEDDLEEDTGVESSMANAHSTTPYPPLYLVPSSVGKSDWHLFPSNYAQVCTPCHTKIIGERNSYQNARFRVRLVRSADEALNEGIECINPTQEQESVLTFPSDVEADQQSPTDQERNKVGVGGSGDVWHPKVLRVDAKLVFAPLVRLSRIQLRCLLIAIPETVTGDTQSPSGIDKPVVDTINLPIEPYSLTESAAASPYSSSQVSTSSSSGSTKPSAIKMNVIKSSWKRGSPSVPSQAFVRRSTRQRLHPNDLVVQGSSDQPLQHIKLQLMQLLGVTPSDQHLMLKGVELSDHTKTLQELGIHADSLLYLWTDGPVWNTNGAGTDSDNSQSFKRSAVPKAAPSPKLSNSYKSNNTVPVELGFKGTRLLEN